MARYESRTPVCCVQAPSNNPEVSVPSFLAWPTFTHLRQTPSANSQLSNKYSPVHFRPSRETKGGVNRGEKSGILTAVQSRWSWRCYSLAPIWEQQNLSPFLSSHASVFLPSLRTHLFLISVLSSRVSSDVRGQHVVPEFWIHLHLQTHILWWDFPPTGPRGAQYFLHRTLMRAPGENVKRNVPEDTTLFIYFFYCCSYVIKNVQKGLHKLVCTI